MNAAVQIRAALPDDLADLIDIETAAFADSWTPQQLANELEERHALVLLAHRGTPPAPLGFAAFRHIAGEAELLRLAVTPAARRLGIGRALTADGLARLRQTGCAGCYLEVRTTNHPAIALYESLDFRRAGIRRAYYGDGTDALVMKRDL